MITFQDVTISPVAIFSILCYNKKIRMLKFVNIEFDLEKSFNVEQLCKTCDHLYKIKFTKCVFQNTKYLIALSKTVSQVYVQDCELKRATFTELEETYKYYKETGIQWSFTFETSVAMT